MQRTEIIDLAALLYISKNAKRIVLPNGKKFDPEYIKRVKKVIKEAVPLKDGSGFAQLKVCYGEAKTLGSYKKRVYADIGLQSIKRAVRHTIAHKKYFDIDAVNCQPSILEQYAKKKGWECSGLSHYNANRNDLLQQLKELGYDKDTVKNVINASMNGGKGNYHEMCRTFESQGKEVPNWIHEVYEDMVNLLAKNARLPEHVPLLPTIKETKEEKKMKDKSVSLDPKGSMLNAVLCDIEYQALEACMKFMDENEHDMSASVLIHDGFMVLKDVLDEIDHVFLEEMSDFVEENTGYRLEYVVKPMDEIITIPEDEYAKEVKKINKSTAKSVAATLEGRYDQQIVNKMLDFFDEKVYNVDTNDSCNLFLYDEQTGKWSMNPDDHMAIIERNSVQLFAVEEEDDDDTGKKNPLKNKSFKSIYETVYPLFRAKAPKKDCATWMSNDNQIGHLLFTNGVLDMKNFVMLPFDPKYQFTKGINRPFDTSIDYKKGIKQIMKRLFKKQFTDTEKMEYYLELKSRGIAGCYKDRQYMVGVGPTSCGKGQTNRLSQNAFGAYISSFNGEELLAKSNESGDVSVGMKFLMDIYDSRISFSNEMTLTYNQKTKKLQGFQPNLIKKLTGGGDVITSRKLYANNMGVINKSMMFLLVNDIPETPGVDEAFIYRTNYIIYDRSSKKDIEEDTDLYFKADDTINEFVADPYIIDSYVAMMCDYYSDTCEHGRMDKPECVKLITKEMTGFDQVDDGAYFKNNFKVTDAQTIKSWITRPGSKETKFYCLVDWDEVGKNYIDTDELYEPYNAKFPGSKAKMTMLLEKMGIVRASKKIHGKTTVVYVGISQHFGDDIDPDFYNPEKDC